MNVRLVLAAATIGHAGPAWADDWVVAEAPAAFAVSAAQEGLFRPGAMPALGVYHETSVAAVGLRMRAGVLRDGRAPGNGLKDPGVGGLGSAGVAVRFARRGMWIEAVGGAGVTGKDVVPVVEAGFGWDFAVGGVDLGPSLRYVRLQHGDPMLGSADLVLVGVDVQLGKDRPHHAVLPPPRVEVAPAVEVDRDRDEDLVETDASCATDGTGCDTTGAELAAALDAGLVEITDDRIVLDERVLFDLDRARVRSAGRAVIAAIAKTWTAHPEWTKLVIEGHADVRGPDDYNLELSRRRAEHARDVLLHLGVAPDRVDAVGYGRARPRDPGTSEAAHQRNRRVEFVIVRAGSNS
jgi:outer membrane protein OmpA-like peptidoglycan-associated protein